MIVFALADEIQLSVLTEAIASVCTERGRVSVFGVAESIRGRSAVAVVDRRHYLSADRGCKLIVAALHRFGIKAYLFVRQRIGIAARKRPEKFAAFNKSAYIVLARYIGKGKGQISEHLLNFLSGHDKASHSSTLLCSLCEIRAAVWSL